MSVIEISIKDINVLNNVKDKCLRMKHMSYERFNEAESDAAHHGATLNDFAIKKLFLQMNCTETEKKT